MARNAAAHAGRTLVILLIGIAVLFGLVALGGTWKPALGLDLQGGTRITLIATGNPDKEAMEEARSIIDQRVNARGAVGSIAVKADQPEEQSDQDLPGAAAGTEEN